MREAESRVASAFRTSAEEGHHKAHILRERQIILSVPSFRHDVEKTIRQQKCLEVRGDGRRRMAERTRTDDY